MNVKPVSVAGANSLLGQFLLARLVADPGVSVVSLHDRLALGGATSIVASQQWMQAPEVAERLAPVPLLPPEAPALAPLLLSFLSDERAAGIEAAHLARGTRVITHSEQARLTAPLVQPGVTPIDPAARHLATPNCTTAICARPLAHLHAVHGVAGATITTLQAISGTDLPGMSAAVIHDQVAGHVGGEADALRDELAILTGGAFPIDTFATRVPVWRGHTITLSVTLSDGADAAAVARSLRGAPGIALPQAVPGRDRFGPDAPLTTVANLRDGAQGVLMVLKGDNLEAATTGLMQAVLAELSV